MLFVIAFQDGLIFKKIFELSFDDFITLTLFDYLRISLVFVIFGLCCYGIFRIIENINNVRMKNKMLKK